MFIDSNIDHRAARHLLHSSKTLSIVASVSPSLACHGSPLATKATSLMDTILWAHASLATPLI